MFFVQPSSPNRGGHQVSRLYFVAVFFICQLFVLNGEAQGILIRPGTRLVVKGSPTIVVRNGSFINQGGFDPGTGTVVMSGHVDSTQAFVEGVSTFFNYQINKSGNSSIQLRGPLNVRSVLTVTSGRLTCDSNLYLKSDAELTARVAPLVGTAQIHGIAHVERYVPARRAWRLMTAPHTGTATVFETWQNRGVLTPGWGTLVTGPSPTGPGGNGLDVSPMNNVSLRRWNASTQAFSNITNTHVPVSAGSAGSGDNTGYFIFVRGDRNPDNVFVPNTNITTLRTTGRLQTGNQSFTCANRRGQFTLIGNPYASPVDMNQVARTNLLKRIYVWDPRVNQVGAYVMLDDLDNDGVWTKSLLASQQTEHIQSTQAFFVETQNDATASIRFQENFKSTLNNNEAFRPAGISSSSASQQDAQTGDAGESNVPASLTPALYTTLYLTDAQGTRELADGNVAEFHAMFADSVNLEDAVKLTNQNETLGLFRNGVSLTAERRQPLQVTDTLFFRLSSTSVRTYQLEFNPFNMPAGPLQGILVDRFLQTQTLISLQVPTRVDFQVTDQAASAASDRFFLIFRPITIVPVDFLRITASPVSERNIQVQWDIEQERQVAHYEVERSVDGRLFRKIGQVTARGGFTGRMSYTFLDEGLNAGNYFYRIQSVDVDGRRGVSPIAQAKLGGTIGSGISLYPNPVEGNQLNIQWTGMKSSTVQVSIVAANGQRVYTNVVSLAAAQGATVIRPSLVLPAGTYWLEWQTDANTVLREAFVVQ